MTEEEYDTYLEAFFRGRHLKGKEVRLPEHYAGIIFDLSNNVAGKSVWTGVAKFDQFTYWNHDINPTSGDEVRPYPSPQVSLSPLCSLSSLFVSFCVCSVLRTRKVPHALEYLQMAAALHQPHTREEVVATLKAYDESRKGAAKTE